MGSDKEEKKMKKKDIERTTNFLEKVEGRKIVVLEHWCASEGEWTFLEGQNE